MDTQNQPLSPRHPNQEAQKANKSRPTTTRTFRIFKDQADHIDKNNPNLGSFFVRYLIDCWRAGKIPISVRQGYFDLRKLERERVSKLKAEKTNTKTKIKVGT